MFLKIYKHSFLSSLKTILPLLIIQPSLGVIGGILSKLSVIFKDNLHLATALASISSMMMAAISIMSFAEVIMAISAFKKAVATDEAYLTYTLPATAGQQLGARTLTIATWFVISSVVASISLTIFSVLAGTSALRPIIDSSVDLSGLTGESALIVFEIVLLAIVFGVSILFHVVFGVLLAQKLSTKTKTRSANILTGMLGFVEMVVILVIFINLLVGLLNSENMEVLNAGIHIFLWTMIGIFAFAGGCCYFLSYKFMSRWLNLE